MHLNQIKTFVTVAELGHLTKAAGMLHLTQPAVSVQLKSLEEELNVKLLDRTASGMVMTQAGHVLLPMAKRVLSAVEEFRMAADIHTKALAGLLRIGVIMIDPDYLRLGTLMSALSEKHAGLEVNLQVSGVQRCISGIEEGSLDGAFYAGERPHSAIAMKTLTPLRYCIVAPVSWAHLLENISWSNLGLMPWIRAPQPSAHYSLVAGIFQHASIEPLKILEVDHESVIMSLIKAGVGLSVIREDLAREAASRGEIIVCEFSPIVQVPLSFIYRADRAQEPRLTAFLETLDAVWGPANDTKGLHQQQL